MEGAFLPVPNPVAFTIFGVSIRWYGILIVAGIVCGVLLMWARAPRYGIDREKVLDLVLWVVPIGVIGARLYYVIFEWDLYKDNLLQIFNLRAGGLAIHGGLIAGILTGLFLMHRWKQNAWRWLDLAAPGIALAQAIGRWGNYFNSEAHGGPTTLPWAIYADGQLVHPTFLYESLWCLLVCLFLLAFERKGKAQFDGQIFLLYAILYSIERYLVEQLRTDSLYIGPLRQAQVFSLCVIAGSLILWVYLSRKKAGVLPSAAGESQAAGEASQSPESKLPEGNETEAPQEPSAKSEPLSQSGPGDGPEQAEEEKQEAQPQAAFSKAKPDPEEARKRHPA